MSRPDRRERSLLIDDAAAVLGVSRRTVYYRIKEGRLRTIRARCGSQRVLVSSIEALLREMSAGRRRPVNPVGPDRATEDRGGKSSDEALTV